MQGLMRVAGYGPPVTINGREFKIRGKTNAYYADVETEIIRLRGDPMESIVEAAKKLRDEPDALSRVAAEVADKFRNWRFSTYRDYLDYMNTPDGDALTVWHALKDDAPDISREQIKLWLTQTKFYGTEEEAEKVKELYQSIRIASGEDQLGNSTGQPGQGPILIPVASSGS